MHRALRPAVYWFWSSIPTRAEAERQVAEIAAAGFGAVMIQARLSFPRAEYLSPDYLAGYRTAAEAAIAAGLEVVVYDDYNWASGHAGGHTVAGAAGDPLRERHLVWSTAGPGQRTATVSEIASPWFDGLGEAGTRWIYEDGARRLDEWALVAAVAHPGDGATPFGPRRDAPRDVTRWARCEGGDEGCAFTLDDAAPLPDGWAVSFYASARCASSRLVDYLEPAAAQRFIEVTHEPYARALEGLDVTGFSFDHPYGGFYTWRERDGVIGNSLMWNPALESWGPLLLHAVIHDAGPRGRRARCRFFAAYAARGIDSFFGALADWTREHGYGLTGHELLAHVGGWSLHDGFAELDARTNFGADHFAIDRHRSQTLVDAMGSDPQLSPRFGDSVARASGRSRCTVELYYARRDPPEDFAAGEWELTLPQLRRAALRMHLLGARRFLFHAYHQTDGRDGDPAPLSNPRFDFPPAINFEPWFAWFGALAEESARLSAFIEGAEPIRDVALVYPLATVWADGPGHPHGRRFGDWAQRLARAGIGFDVVDDRALDAAVVRDGRLSIPGSIPGSAHVAAGPDARGYAAVVLPGAATLPSRRTVEALEALAAAGGTVVATAPLPDLTGAAGSDTPFGARDDGLAERVAATSAIPVSDAVPQRVPEVLRRCDTAPAWGLDGADGTVWRWTGRAEEGVRVALFNEGPVTRELRLAAACGEPGVAHSGAPVTLALEPDELACLTLTTAGDFSRPGAHNSPRVPGPLARTAREVVLADGWTLSAGGAPAVSIDPSIGWERQGHATFAGVGTYRCAFDLETDLETGLAADRAAAWTLELPVVHCAASATLNGAALGERGWPPYRFAIAPGTLRATDNQLQVAVANSAANRYYAGTRFALAPQPSGLGAAPRLGRR